MKRARCPAILSALLVALFLAACAPPPTGTVSGYVVNRKAGTPVAGTRVRAEGSNASTVTDDAGFYSLTVPAGDV
ncbi:MAG TPA: carboxypeptidase regulatory-like domain-containing protein, partial [Trueperaceae bacterium]